MTCEIAVHKRVVVVRWDRPEVSDVTSVMRAIVEVHKAQGAPAIFVGLAPAASEAPSEDVRRVMARSMPILLQHCDRIFALIDDEGFRGTLVRMAVAAMILGAGQRKKISVHHHAEEIVSAVDASLRPQVVAAFRHAEGKGIVNVTSRGTRPAAHPPSASLPR